MCCNLVTCNEYELAFAFFNINIEGHFNFCHQLWSHVNKNILKTRMITTSYE